MSNTSVTLKEITTTVRHLKAAVKKGNRALFDNNAAYLRNMVHALILEQSKTFEPLVLPLYAVRIYSQITETEATFDVRAANENDAIRNLVNRGFHGDKHIVRSVNLVQK